jgi:hypothetical protein
MRPSSATAIGFVNSLLIPRIIHLVYLKMQEDIAAAGAEFCTLGMFILGMFCLAALALRRIAYLWSGLVM